MSTKKSPFDNIEPVPERTQETVFGVKPIGVIATPVRTIQHEVNAINVPSAQTVVVPAGCELIIFNKKFAPALLTELDEITTALIGLKPVTTQDEVVSVNSVLKNASRFVKKFDEQRKAMGEVLTKYKDSLLLDQKQTLSEIMDYIEAKNNEIVIFQKAQAKIQAEREAKIQAQKDAEIKKANAENARKQNILNLIAQFESNCLNEISNATIATIDNLIYSFDLFKLKEETYMEYMQQAGAVQVSLRLKFVNRKSELVKLAELEATNKEQAEQLKAQQDRQAAADKQASITRNAQQANAAAEQAQSDIANTQMQAELKSSALPAARNVMKRWTFDTTQVDMASLPIEYHAPDTDKIKAAIAAGARSIPGVVIFEEISNVKR